MKSRSPVLGYNHNVRYAQMSWHVQTEDSGVQNPHIFTHLFHDGNVLASKKLDYDASSDVTTVQKLMQSQHKQMLRDLKSGSFDAKIESRYGPIQRERTGDTDKSIPVQPEAPIDTAADAAAPTTGGAADIAASIESAIAEAPPSPPPPAPIASSPPPAPVRRGRSPEDERATVPDLTPLLTPPPARPPTDVPVRPLGDAPARRPSLTPSRPSIAVSARPGSGTSVPSAPPPSRAAARAAAAPPPTIGSSRSGAAAQTSRPTQESVIVARPTVIVGKDSGKQREAADFWKTERRTPAPDPAFGGDLISEKSLDEVILAYLSEDAPKK